MKKVFFSTVFVVLMSVCAFAQSDYKKGEFYVGYSPNFIDGGDPVTGDSKVFHGAGFSGVYNVSRYVGIKGDFSFHTRKFKTTVGAASFELNGNLQNYLGGVQFKDNSSDKKVKPFAHALIGAGRTKAEAVVLGTKVSDTETGLSMAFGGGVDVKVGEKVSIRAIQADYNPIRSNGSTGNNFRLGFGIVF